MTNIPTFPLIVISNLGYLDLVENEEYLTNTNALGLIKGFHKNLRCYDINGSIWKVNNIESKYKINGLSKFLANTFYNPSIKVTFMWTKGNEYLIDDLKNEINNQIDEDKDILTQFHEAEIIKKRISSCYSFHEILVTLNKFVFRVDEDKIFGEQVHRE